MCRNYKSFSYRLYGYYLSVFFNLFLANAGAADDVVARTLYEIKFERFSLSVAAPLDQSKYSSSAESVGESYVESWTSKDCSAVAFENNLVVNGRHFLIPDKASAVWYISHNVFVPDVGVIRPSPIPERVNSALEERYDNFEVFHGGIKFVMEKSFFASSDFKINNKRFDVIIGDMYFIVENGRLLYKAKDYGKVSPGDVVRVSESRKLTIIPK